MPVPDGLFGTTFLEIGEKIGKGLRNGRPAAILLIEAVGASQMRVDSGIAIWVEMESAMARGRMADDALGIVRGMIR